MQIVQDALAAERILSLVFQAVCVMILGWVGIKLSANRGAPLRSWISIATILLLFFLPLLHGVHLLRGGSAWGNQLPLSNEITIEVNSSGAVGPTEGFSLLQLPSWLAQQFRTFFTGSRLVRLVNTGGLLWGIGILLFLGRLCCAAVSLQRFKRDLVEVHEERVLKILERTKASFPRNFRTKICISPRVKSPISLGILDSAVVFPQDLMARLSDRDIRGILLHELSHFYHRDQVAGLLQRLVTALYWWNPIVYSLSAHCSRAREEISDNHVLLENNSQEYAECLINLAESTSRISRMPVLTGLASPHIPLKDRVNKILSKERIMETQLKKGTVLLIVAASIIVIGIVAGNRVSFATGDIPAKNVTVYGDSQVSPPAQEKQPVRASGDIKPPKLLKKVEPVYPEEARKKGIEGVVIIEATTDIYGRVVETEVLRSIPALSAAAVAAVRQWVYEPYIEDGEPRSIIFTVSVNFKLSEKSEKNAAAAPEGRKPDTAASVDKDIKQPRLIKKVEPVYPDEAREEGVEGVVVLEATTDIYGRVTKVKVLKGDDERLNKAAVKALKQWIYEPFIIDGKPVGVEFTVNFRFRLKNKNKR